MSRKSTRTRSHRRERRLAKQSEWTREPKKNSTKIGHGASATGFARASLRGLKPRKQTEQTPDEPTVEPLKFNLGCVSHLLRSKNNSC